MASDIDTVRLRHFALHVRELKSDSKKFIPAFWRDLDYKGEKELFISHAIVIEYFHFKSVLAFQLHQGDMVRA